MISSVSATVTLYEDFGDWVRVKFSRPSLSCEQQLVRFTCDSSNSNKPVFQLKSFNCNVHVLLLRLDSSRLVIRRPPYLLARLFSEGPLPIQVQSPPLPSLVWKILQRCSRSSSSTRFLIRRPPYLLAPLFSEGPLPIQVQSPLLPSLVWKFWLSSVSVKRWILARNLKVYLPHRTPKVHRSGYISLGKLAIYWISFFFTKVNSQASGSWHYSVVAIIYFTVRPVCKCLVNFGSCLC